MFGGGEVGEEGGWTKGVEKGNRKKKLRRRRLRQKNEERRILCEKLEEIENILKIIKK